MYEAVMLQMLLQNITNNFTKSLSIDDYTMLFIVLPQIYILSTRRCLT